MPGFASTQESQNYAVGPSTVFNFEDLPQQIFYGFRYDVFSGKLTVEKINDGSVVSLPSEYFQNVNDYRQWVWTKRSLNFSWSNTGKQDRLQVRID
jgi:hypothetical protein